MVHNKYPGVRVCASVDELLSLPEIDLIINTAPTGLHYELTKKALLAGKHCVVEKPMAATVQESEDLVRVMREVWVFAPPLYTLLLSPAFCASLSHPPPPLSF